MSRETLEALIAAGKFTEPLFNEWVAEHMRPVVAFDVTTGTPSLGQSKIGGNPDLPPRFPWPRGKAFIAQFNFAEVHPFDEEGGLPATGLLSIFASTDESELIDDFDAIDVFHHCGDEPLVSTDIPDDGTEGRYEERPLVFGTTYALIGPATGCWRPQHSKPHDFHYSPFQRRDHDVFKELVLEAGLMLPTLGFMAGVGCFYDRNARQPFSAATDIEAVCLDGNAVLRTSGIASIYAGGIFHVFGRKAAVKEGTFRALFEL